MTAGWCMAILILSPLTAASLAFAVPRRGRDVSFVTATVVGVALVELFREVRVLGVQTHRVGGWGAPLGIDLRADGLAMLMLLVTAGIGIAVALYATRYFVTAHDDHAESRHRQRYFWPLFLFLWTALNALFLSADIFNLYVTLELLGFAAVTLVALAGQREALSAALRYMMVSLSASLFYLLGVALVYGQCGTVDLPTLAAHAESGPVLWVALALMTGGLITKAALFPMHFWLPPAHANAPAPVSALLSALVVKGPIYILLRLWFEAFPALMTSVIAQAFGVLGSAAILWGSIQALRQQRLKLLVAYSTVAQLGYLFLLLPLTATSVAGSTAWSGGLMLLGAHACAKAAMFLTAGNILQVTGHDRIRELDGFAHRLPLSAFAFGLAGISLMGLPPSGGFAGKWLLLNAALTQGQWWWVVVLVAGGLLSAAYVARVLAHAFTQVDESTTLSSMPRIMEWTPLCLALVAVLLGFATSGAADLLQVGAPELAQSAKGGTEP